MSMDSLLIGAIIAIVCGAMCFYIYVRMSYLEKKVSMMESIMVDIKVAMDNLMDEGIRSYMGGGPGGNAMPISSGAGGSESAPETMEAASMPDATAIETIPEESFYSSVLDAAHEGATVPANGSTTADQALEGIKLVEEEAAASGEPIPSIGGANTMDQQYDSMTKQELFNLAEQRGLRAKKNMNRSELITLLRRTDAAQNQGTSTGTENVSGPAGSLFPDAAPLDGDFPVDLGQV